MKDGKFTAGDIYSLLYDRYKDGREWFCAREVGDQTGWQSRRLDFVACNCYASKGQGVYAFEVKISKSDLRNELFDPSKHNIFFDNIDFFSICAPDYVLDAEYIALIPKNWGIVKAVAGKSEGEPNKLVTVRKPLALHDEKRRTMDKEFVMAMLRRLRDDPSNKGTEAEIRHAEYQKGFQDGIRRSVNQDYEKLYHELRKKVTLYETALRYLGVCNYWNWTDNDNLLPDVKKRAARIEKFERLGYAMSDFDFHFNKIKESLDKLQESIEPLKKAKEDADKIEFEGETKETTNEHQEDH